MNDQRRQRIAQLEAQLRETRQELVGLLRLDPPEPVEDALFAVEGGELRLSELFGSHDVLILAHNMGKQCPWCTLWMDGFQGLLPHLAQRAAFAVCSPDAPVEQAAFAAARGWAVRMVQDASGDFTRAMGYRVPSEDGEGEALWPGYSVFHKAADGALTRTAHDFWGPGDPYCGLWHFLDLLPNGPEGWMPQLAY